LDEINYRNGKALLIDTSDLIELNSLIKSKTEIDLVEKLDSARHLFDYILIITSLDPQSWPRWFRNRVLEMNREMVPCYRVFLSEEVDKRARGGV